MLTRWAYFLRRLGIVLALYMGLRGLFFVFNYHRFSASAPEELRPPFCKALGSTLQP